VSGGLRRGGIIAAGEGRRLRAGGYAMPKALVPVNGVPLLERVLGNFRAAGIESVVVIVNEDSRACIDWVQRRDLAVDVEFIVKTTASSLESFLTVSTQLGDGPALISTVDAWCRPGDFTRFVRAATRWLPAASVLALTPLVADETPLWASLDASGRIVRLGEDAGPLVTAGVYLLSAAARADTPPAGLHRLRDYLSWLVDRQPVYAEIVDTVVDVDGPDDVALAQTLTAQDGERDRIGGDR
jgi:NDP-sugar pyrophosphorylase family protein